MRKLLFVLLLLIAVGVTAKNDSKFISQSAPESIEPGEIFNYSVTFKNTGTTTWTTKGNYNLGTQAPQDNTTWMNKTRIRLPHSVSPGEEVTFNAALTAPTEVGMHALQWRIVQDGIEWFGEYSIAIEFPILETYADSLLIEGNHLAISDHIVSSSFFTWYGEHTGQLVGPFIPINGRDSWDNSIEFWRRMIKQVMTANIDVLYVELIPAYEQNRGNFFIALKTLRAEGWRVPKICPFLDPQITYAILGYDGDCATEEGKDELIGHYIRFYKQYFVANTDEFADDYIYTQDNHVVLNMWHIQIHIDNYKLLRRSDVTNRLRDEFGEEHPIFNNSIKMINNAYSPAFSFTDERIYQFEMQEYKIDKEWNGINSSLLKPGYWDQNVRNPGFQLLRDGGSHYSESWDKVNSDATIDRVYIESFNEYDEGSGIFAAQTDTIYTKTSGGMNNTGSDLWSSSDNPYEYIKTTAAGAAEFNDFKTNDAKIIWHNIPDEIVAGETFFAKVIVLNTGNAAWSASANYKFGQEDSDTESFGAARYLIDDTEDEIPEYGGIFRGRAKTFELEIIAPEKTGSYETHWRMLQEDVEWFGDTITKTIKVVTATALNDIETQNTFVVYPNPAKLNSSIHFEGHFNPNDKIIFYNTVGVEIFEKQFLSNENNFQLNPMLNGFNEGIYIIKFMRGNTISTQKIIINN